MSSKGPRSPQILKRSLKSSKNSEVLKRPTKSSYHQKVLKKVIKVLMTSGAQMILKRSSNSSMSSMSSKGPRSPHILKTSLKSSKRLQNVLKFGPRSSVGPQILETFSMSPKILESPQKQLKVHRFSGPQFQKRSWKDPQKVLKSYSKCPQKVIKVLKMFWKSSKCPQSTQFLK